MANEYLNDCTDRMFQVIHKTFASGTLETVEVALQFYETVLRRAKFRSQAWYFQKKLWELNQPFTAGYFQKRKRELSPTVATDIEEYFKSKE